MYLPAPLSHTATITMIQLTDELNLRLTKLLLLLFKGTPPHLWGLTLMTPTFYVIIISYGPDKGRKWPQKILRSQGQGQGQ